MLYNLDAHPYTDDVDEALRPHLPLLRDILERGWESFPDIPACKAALEAREKASIRDEAARRGMVQDYGDLDIVQQSQINNWIARNVRGAREATHLWQGGPLNAHAATLVIAQHRRKLIESSSTYPHHSQDMEERLAYTLREAWEYQTHTSGSLFCDVDLESLSLLEEAMFESSARTDIAGYYQWGLDAGDHQNGWDPYEGLMTGGFEPTHPDEVLAVSLFVRLYINDWPLI